MKYYFIILSTLLTFCCSAQKFQGTYGTAEEDSFNTIVELPDGNFITGGHSSGFSGGVDDLIFYKISALGEFISQKAFGGINSETIEELALLENGNIAFLGSTGSYSQTGDFDLFFGVLTQELEVLWCKHTLSTGSETGRDLKITADQNLLITGVGNAYGPDGTFDLVVMKCSIEGDILWSKVLGLTDYEVSLSCVEDHEGNLYIWGHCNSESTQQYDGLLVQLNQAGEVNWSKSFGGPNNELASSATAHPDGGVLVTGDTSSFGSGLKDCFVMHIDSNGEVIWSNTYGTNLHDHGTALANHVNESFFLGGISGGFGAGGLDMLSLLIDLDGVLKYGQAYGGPIKETCYDVTSCADGGAAFVGYTRSYGEGFNSGFITKLDVHGSSGCAQTYGATVETMAFEFDETIVDMELKTENIEIGPLEMDEVVTAYVHSALVCEINYITEMDNPELNANPESSFDTELLPELEQVDFHKNISLYPNPTQGNAWLEIATTEDELLELAFMDINGRTLWSSSMQIEGEWKHKINIPVQEFDTGVYFLQIKTSQNHALQRLILD